MISYSLACHFDAECRIKALGALTQEDKHDGLISKRIQTDEDEWMKGAVIKQTVWILRKKRKFFFLSERLLQNCCY
jgi:hypothetical protein